MSNDDFFERLRGDAGQLRFDADEVTISRLAARVRERVAQPTAAQLLAGWFRPLTASLATLALVAVLGVRWVDSTPETSLDTAMSSSSVEISIDGESYALTE